MPVYLTSLSEMITMPVAVNADTTERLVYPEAVNLMVNKFKVVASASAASLISNTCKYTENG